MDNLSSDEAVAEHRAIIAAFEAKDAAAAEAAVWRHLSHGQ